MPEPTIEITDEQAAFFHENGYLQLDCISPPEEIEQFRAWYDEMFERKAGRETGDQFDLAGADEDDKPPVLPQILNPEKHQPAFRETIARANAQAIAEALFGEEAKAAGAHCIMKPAGYGAETPWHQDEAYWDPMMDYRSSSIWMPLQDATVENGCLWFVPGSHRLEVLEHQSVGGDPRVHALELVEHEQHHVQGAVACPLPAGGCTIHASRTLHYAGPNTSDITRRAYILNAAAPATKRDSERRFPWNEIKQAARQDRAAAARPADA